MSCSSDYAAKDRLAVVLFAFRVLSLDWKLWILLVGQIGFLIWLSSYMSSKKVFDWSIWWDWSSSMKSSSDSPSKFARKQSFSLRTPLFGESKAGD